MRLNRGRLMGDETAPIAENVRRLRQAAGLTQQSLAMASGLSMSVVSQMEQGTITDPRLSSLLALAKALKCTMDELVGETTRDTMSPAEPPAPKKPGRPRKPAEPEVAPPDDPAPEMPKKKGRKGKEAK